MIQLVILNKEETERRGVVALFIEVKGSDQATSLSHLMGLMKLPSCSG
jgi:hypothetical protein